MILDKLLPLALFLSLSALAHILIAPNLEALTIPLRAQCQVDLTPNYTSLTGTSFDNFFCLMVSVFRIALEPKTSPFLAYFFATCIPASTLFLFLESHRKGRHWLIGYTGLIGGILGQGLTVAVVTPVWWIYFAWTAEQKMGSITEAHAEASVFGAIMGWFIPSIALFTMTDPTITAIWQFAPILAFVAEITHLTIRPPTVLSHSGFRTIQAAYIFFFIVTSSFHINTMAKYTSFDKFEALFVPTINATSLSSAALNIFQIDYYITSLGFAFGSLWFARSILEVCRLAAWTIAGSILFSPAAAFLAAALWRESYLEGARLKADSTAEVVEKDDKKRDTRRRRRRDGT